MECNGGVRWEEVRDCDAWWSPLSGEGGAKSTRSPLYFGKGSFLRNEPQYPTKGYAPHSGRGGVLGSLSVRTRLWFISMKS